MFLALNCNMINDGYMMNVYYKLNNCSNTYKINCILFYDTTKDFAQFIVYTLHYLKYFKYY